MCGIYIIKNIVNNKSYIGQAKDIAHRWSTHKCELNAGRHSNRHLQGAWNKYGCQSFIFDILEECLEKDLDQREMYYIDLYKSYSNGYNLDCGGQGVIGFKHTEEEINKMRKVQNPLVVLQFDMNFNLINRFEGGSSHARKDNGYTKECIDRCCQHRGNKIDYKNCYWVYEEEYQNSCFTWEKYLKQEYCCEINHIKKQYMCKKIYQYTKDRVLIKIWDCFKDIEDAGYIKNQVNTICNRRKGKKTHRGFIWVYEDYDWSDGYFDNLNDSYTDSIINRMLPVKQINENGVCVKTYLSRTEAAKNMNIDSACISKAIKSHSVCCGYFWANDENDDFFNDIENLHNIMNLSTQNQQKSVKQLDCNGKCIHIYKSRSDAGRAVGSSVGNISRAIKEHRICKGFYWE